MTRPIIKVIIPALNEQNAVPEVIREIPFDLVNEVIVVDNGSHDKTFENAEKAGAKAIKEPRKGYGQACLTGLDYVAGQNRKPDIIVFVDGDHSDFPAEMPNVVHPIIESNYDLVIGSRALGSKESGSMTFPQVFGNWLATTLIRWFYGVRFTDLGPFRAISYTKLLELEMVDRNFGWTVEMQVKAAKKSMRCTEVPVNYRRRIGVSKVSGTLKGTIMAGYKILWTIFKYL